MAADRDEKGRFLVGNKAGVGHGAPHGNRQLELATYFRTLCKTEDAAAIYAAMLDLALNCPEFKTRLAAQIHWLDRAIGKVKDVVNLEVKNNGNVDDIPEAMARLRNLLNQTTKPQPTPNFEVLDNE